jgi:branched-subunit amino acid transport protein AzlD
MTLAEALLLGSSAAVIHLMSVTTIIAAVRVLPFRWLESAWNQGGYIPNLGRAVACLVGALLVSTQLAACTIPIETRSAAPCSAVDAGTFRLVSSSGLLMLQGEDGRTFSAIWPAGYSAEHRDGEAVVLDGDGDIAAREGDLLGIGGGGQDVSGTVTVCTVEIVEDDS